MSSIKSPGSNVTLLFFAQSLGGASPPIIISLGGIVGQMLSTNPALVTLPVSLYNLGLALSTIPAALLMRRAGRRSAYLMGASFGMASGLVAGLGIFMADFMLFCLGTAMAGFYGACVQSYRFAATEGLPSSAHGQAISRVMLGGLLAAVIGPQVVIWTRDAIPSAPFAGSFFGQAALALLVIPLLLRMRPAQSPTIATPPAPGGRASAQTTGHDDGLAARPLSEIASSPRFIVAVASGVVTYGLMSFVMTAAPIAMVGCGHTIGEAALGIQWHVLAMFGPSFFTGRLIKRFGKYRITMVGLALTACSALTALAGLDLLNFWGSLVLLGIGWNFGFIGATAMVTDCYRPSERNKVQALNDFLVFGTVAIASFSSGRLLTLSGWDTINTALLPIVAALIVLIATMARRDSRMRVGA